MNIRKVKLIDAQGILKIRNNFIIRELSNDTTEINLEQHLKWLQMKIETSNDIYLISEDNIGNITGYCRLDYIETGKYLVSIAIDPKIISKGLGSKLLLSSLGYLVNGDIVNAEILDNNIISINFFKKFGFIKQEENLYQLEIIHD